MEIDYFEQVRFILLHVAVVAKDLKVLIPIVSILVGFAFVFSSALVALQLIVAEIAAANLFLGYRDEN